MEILTRYEWEQRLQGDGADVRVLMFSSSGCAPCYPVKAELQKLADAGLIGLTVVDANLSGQLVEMYGVSGLPTVVVFDGGRQMTNYLTSADLRGNIGDALQLSTRSRSLMGGAR